MVAAFISPAVRASFVQDFQGRRPIGITIEYLSGPAVLQANAIDISRMNGNGNIQQQAVQNNNQDRVPLHSGNTQSRQKLMMPHSSFVNHD